MQGQVLLDGRDIAELDANGLMAARRRMGMLFQFGALFTDLTVFENVAFPLREHTDLSDALVRDIVLMKLHAVGLRGARDLMPSQISGGMARRVALARAFVGEPKLLFADEPTGNLDSQTANEVFALLRRIHAERGTSFVVVTHDPRLAARCDRLVELIDGRIARDEAVTAGMEPAPSALPV